MVDKTDNMMQEYLMLQGKIDQYTNIDYSLRTLEITAAVTIFGFAFSNRIALLYFIPAIIIISLDLARLYISETVIKLKSYTIVFHESNCKGIGWETRNLIFRDIFSRKNNFIIWVGSILFKYSSFLLLILSAVLYYNMDKNFINSIILYLIPFIDGIFIWNIEFEKSSNHKIKKYINKWIKVKSKDQT